LHTELATSSSASGFNQLSGQVSVWPGREAMLTQAAYTLALARFGGFHFAHGGGPGGGTALVLVGLVFAGVLIWAISRPSRNSA
jgi:hypothetical protein